MKSKNQNLPLVSIILPVYNNERFLLDCLKSLSNQTYKNIEIIAIDDLSKDKSFRILKNFKKTEKRLKIYRNVKHYGLRITLNRCLSKAKGKLIAFMNPHDLSSPQRIKKQFKYLTANPKIAALGVQCNLIDKRNRNVDQIIFPESHEEIQKALFGELAIQFDSLMINKEALPKDLLRFESEDAGMIYKDLLLKIAAYGQLSNLTGFFYRKRKDSNFNTDSRLNQLLTLIKLWLKSTALYDYHPSFRSLFFPLLNTR